MSTEPQKPRRMSLSEAAHSLTAAPVAQEPAECTCICVDPGDWETPAEWEQADDCPVHPLAVAQEPAPDVDAQRRGLGQHDPRDSTHWPAPGGAQEPADPPLWLTAAQAAAHTSMRQDAGAWYDALPRAVLAALPILRAGIEAELIAKIAAWASVNEIAAPPLDWAALSVILNGVQS